MIKFLHREEIDTGKWDDVIAHSPAETLYPYSWYLDASAENWSALVMDDYRFIMPLVWKKKYGIRYLYQPVLCQQLGLFSREFTDPLVIRQFVEILMKRFRFGVVHFNMLNMVGDDQAFEVDDRINYILPLEKNHKALVDAYSLNAKRNLKKSMETGAEVEKDISLEELMVFKKENDLTKKSEDRYRRMEYQFRSVLDHSKGSVYGIRYEGKLVAATFLAFSKTRIIYLLSVSNVAGKEQRAMFGIVDEAIRSFSGSSMILDFEGSNIPSIARFFSGFGARPEVYQRLSFNRLPVPFLPGKRNGK
ncbi:MAG: hypothetical protein V2B15_17865 [Bacteroidota bacterium]